MTPVSGSLPAEPLPFYYVIVVWGEKYVDMLLEVALPCLLAPGNLPGLPNLRESQFLIMTTPQDRARIAASPVFRSLGDIIEPVFVESPWIEQDIPYHLKAARGHQEAATWAADDHAYCVFLAPDFLLSDGALRFLVDTARSGKHAVMVPGIRVVTETILEEIRNTYSTPPGNALSIAPRALVELCLRHVHVENRRYNWDHPCFSQAPVVCTWNIPGEDGLLVRAFHLHPILVRMNNSESAVSLDENTIDGEFLGFNCPNWDAIHVETDSDNIALFSLTEKWDRRQESVPNTASVEQLRTIAFSVLANPLHRYYFTKAIMLHAGELNEKWDRVEKQTGLLAYRALSCAPTWMARNLQTVSARMLLREVASRIVRRLRRYARKLYSLTTLSIFGSMRLSSPEEENIRLKKLVRKLDLEIDRLTRALGASSRSTAERTGHAESQSETRTDG